RPPGSAHGLTRGVVGSSARASTDEAPGRRADGCPWASSGNQDSLTRFGLVVFSLLRSATPRSRFVTAVSAPSMAEACPTTQKWRVSGWHRLRLAGHDDGSGDGGT